jgi:hypothetical protein
MGCIRNENLKNRKTSPADLAETNKKCLIAEGAEVSQRTLRKRILGVLRGTFAIFAV